jgi:formylglycine-generating enzyme required for sulfatase activity
MNILIKTFIIVFVFFEVCSSTALDSKTNAVDNQKSGFQMVFVQGGTFKMGGRDGIDDGGPKSGADTDECPHDVTLGDFSIGKHEVTQADWTAIMGSNPSEFQGDPYRPVDHVSWDDVQEFLRRLNAKLGETFRLPTEQEWEFAARGGLKSKDYRYSGSNIPSDVAWYNGNAGNKTHRVGSLKPNELGLYDMSGNIWEWCSDFKVPYPCDPLGKKFDSRVLRGGTYGNSADSVRVRDRNGRNPQVRLSTLGFRLAK